MLVVCSDCVSSYRIDRAALAGTGATHCAHCRQILRAPSPPHIPDAPVFEQERSVVPFFLIGLVALAATSCLLFCRGSIAAAVPAVAVLEGAIGAGPGPSVPSVTQLAAARERDGLTVTGTLANSGRGKLGLSGLRITVRNSAAEALTSWTSPAPKADLGPGESVSFASRLDKLPPQAHDLTVGFASDDEPLAGSAVKGVQ